MLQSVSWPITCRLFLLTQRLDQMLGVRRHRGWILEALEVFHYLIHLQLGHAFSPDWMPTSQQVVHNDTAGPHISFLSISKYVRHLLRRLVQRRATFREICDLFHLVLNCKSEVDKLNLAQVLEASEDHVVRLDVPMNHVLFIMQVG